VGNDSTSSTIVFAHHMLSQHPDALHRIREEHDIVFGSEPSKAAAQLKDNASLLNQCPYTLAVIKETLRLYPPAATMRISGPGNYITTQRGVSLPISNLTVLVSHHSMHRNPRLWPRPNEFLPERWLVGPEHELFPQRGAWRAFELGPRKCIGQTLALMEIKLVLIMTARTFTITPSYEEFDALQQNRKGWFDRNIRGERTREGLSDKYNGDRVFPTEKAGSHPSNSYPCRVSLRR